MNWNSCCYSHCDEALHTMRECALRTHCRDPIDTVAPHGHNQFHCVYTRITAKRKTILTRRPTTNPTTTWSRSLFTLVGGCRRCGRWISLNLIHVARTAHVITDSSACVSVVRSSGDQNIEYHIGVRRRIWVWTHWMAMYVCAMKTTVTLFVLVWMELYSFVTAHTLTHHVYIVHFFLFVSFPLFRLLSPMPEHNLE